ncbi:hypothetical protein QFC19_008995 [Naganishia cerealis]|uniref:Uncharacterized protein n=1 Tax=Naganishia cerealis TaxID=610337 RepID=A0ACC2UXB6_9TREE|nr:hypothetical protein QFC19_008995 [Naganishia cerealis]
MEDETELALLDTRIAKLDKTIAPFGIKPLIKEAHNLENALSILGGTDVTTKIIKSEFAVGKHEESIISRSPDDSNLREYTNAIDRLLKEIERLSKNDLRSAEARIKDYSRLVDLGARNLIALMFRHINEGCVKPLDLSKVARDDWEEITSELDFEPPVQRLVSETVNALRNPCLRSFPEALVDIRVSQPSGKGETVAVADVTYRTVQYLSTLPSFEQIVTTLLTSLGDRNWLMGAVTASQRQTDGDTIMQHFAADMVSALLDQLGSRGRNMRKFVSAIFMLNNRKALGFHPSYVHDPRLTHDHPLCWRRDPVSYMRNHLIGATDVLGTGGENALNRGFWEARAAYMEVWQDLVALLAESTHSGGAVARLTGASGDKQQVKDSLSNFFVRLDELEAMSKQYLLSRQDPDLRERLVQDVRNLVVPAFSSYAGRHAKRVEKYARATPVEIDQRILGMIP